MKRRIGIILLVLLAFMPLLHSVALADGAGLLTIDNKAVYAGMSKSYEAGYVPTQSGSKVRVVLPLLASAVIQGDTVTVTPNLGAPGSSPFVFGNYIKTVKLSSHSVNNSAASASAFLVDLSLPLASDRMRGSYPVALTVDYKDGSGADMQQTFTLFVTVNGKNPNATPPAPTPEPVRHQPKVIVSKYAVDPDPVVAGGAFTLAFTLQNTSASYAVSNIKVTIKSDSADLTPANNANTQHFKSLAKGKYMEVSIPMEARESATTGSHSITVSVEYDDDKATGFAMSEEIPITVTQPLRLEFDAPNVPADMTAGDTAPFQLQVINKGRSDVYNVMCVLEAPGLLPEASSFLGNMEPGTAKSAQIMVFAGTLDMSSSGDSSGGQFGKTTGKITITYEDEFGKQYSATVDIKTTINEPVIPTTEEEPAPPEKASQWWISVLVAAGLIVVVIAALLLSRKNRSKAVQAREQ